MSGWWKPTGITLTAADGVLTAVADTERTGGQAVFASPRVPAPAGTYDGSVMVENTGTEDVTVQIKIDPSPDSYEKTIPAGGSALVEIRDVDFAESNELMLFVNTASAATWAAGTTLKFTDPIIRAASAEGNPQPLP